MNALENPEKDSKIKKKLSSLALVSLFFLLPMQSKASEVVDFSSEKAGYEALLDDLENDEPEQIAIKLNSNKPKETSWFYIDGQERSFSSVSFSNSSIEHEQEQFKEKHDTEIRHITTVHTHPEACYSDNDGENFCCEVSLPPSTTDLSSYSNSLTSSKVKISEEVIDHFGIWHYEKDEKNLNKKNIFSISEEYNIIELIENSESNAKYLDTLLEISELNTWLLVYETENNLKNENLKEFTRNISTLFPKYLFENEEEQKKVITDLQKYYFSAISANQDNKFLYTKLFSIVIQKYTNQYITAEKPLFTNTNYLHLYNETKEDLTVEADFIKKMQYLKKISLEWQSKSSLHNSRESLINKERELLENIKKTYIEIGLILSYRPHHKN